MEGMSRTEGTDRRRGEKKGRQCQVQPRSHCKEKGSDKSKESGDWTRPRFRRCRTSDGLQRAHCVSLLST